MNDDRVDALIRRLDIPSSPDPAFVAATAAMLRPRVRSARVQDTSRLGRLRRDLWRAGPPPRPWLPRSMAIAGVAVLLLLAVVAAAIVMSGGLRRSTPISNGPLVIAASGQVLAIDVETGSSRSIGTRG